MFTRNWSLLSIIALLVVFAFLAPAALASMPSSVVSVSSGLAAPVQAPAAQDTRGTLVLRGAPQNFPKNFNPLLNDVRVWLYDGLVRFDLDMKPIGDLAESWTISPDGLVYTFKLRQNVKFHDGSAMTADDVIYTAQVTLDEKVNSPYRDKFMIAGKPVKWEKVDDYTVRATLPQPSSSFLAKASRADEIFFTILPKKLLEKCASNMDTCDLNVHPVGTGAFKLREYVPDQRVVLDAFDDYFQGKPGLKRIVILNYPNEQSALAALMAGDMDISTLREAGSIKAVQANPNFSIYNYDSNWVMAARFNMVNPILQDLKVRQAISYAIDRLSLVRAVISPSANIGNGPVNIGWAASPKITKFNFDPAKAKALLDEAGWKAGSDGIRTKDGKRLTLNIAFASLSGRGDLAAGMQQFLKAVGIDLQLKQYEYATFQDVVYKQKNFDIYIDWQGFGVDPDIASRWSTDTSEAGTYLANPTGYSNKDVDAAFKAAATALTIEDRQKNMWKAEDLITQDAQAVWLHLYQATMAANNKTVGGLSLPPTMADMDNQAIFREVWKVTSTRP